MTTPTQTEPPFVPLRRPGWATKRTPLWVFGALVLIVVAGFLVALSVRPSASQQASDLRGYFGDVTTGVGSCAAALRDSMTSYQAVAGGDTAELGTARSIVGYGASNCEVASNESLSDFANYQVTESLDSLRLTAADNDVISWAFDATRYQQDMLAALAAAATPAAQAKAEAALGSDLAALNAERATIDAIWNAAKKSTGDASPLPNLTARAQAGQNASGVSG
jgi:hypothetical protein